MQEKIRLGVIGTGMAWERLHWPALLKLKDRYEIRAVCNKTIEKAQAFAQSILLPMEDVYSDYREMLAREDIDAIDVLVPISENYEVARDVIFAKKPLIAEKPFASSPEAARELIALKNERRVPVLVAENFRYNEESRMIKALLDERALGEAVGFIQVTGAGFAREQLHDTFAAKEWRQHPAFAGGIFLDGGIHDLARLRYFFGDADRLCALGRPQDEEYCPYEQISALMRFENDVIGQYVYFSASVEASVPPVGLRIYCTRGELYLESKECGKLRLVHPSGAVEERRFTPGAGYEQELRNFYDALVYGEAIISTPEKELGDIEFVFALLNSIEQGVALTRA